MERKSFFKKSIGIIGAVGILPILDACKKDAADTTSTTTGTTTEGGSCIISPTEEEGPFPYTADGTTKSEISNPLNRIDIRSNNGDGVLQTGIPLAITFTVVNTNDNCATIQNARVDIWHCNKDGWYSGYGNQSGGVSGTGSSYIGQTWLRGYQTTDANGQAQFTTIYPGWYQGRATHVHIEVFINNVLKKQTQFAFVEAISDVVHVSSLYSAHGVNTTRNASDSVFGNSATDIANETFTLSGNITDGYTAVHNIGIAL